LLPIRWRLLFCCQNCPQLGPKLVNRHIVKLVRLGGSFPPIADITPDCSLNACPLTGPTDELASPYLGV
jgi:hypothetical protein